MDDRLVRCELRSQWLHDTELTGGVRGRDARLDHEVDIERRTQQHRSSDLLYQCRQQHDVLQHEPEPRELSFLYEVRVQVLLSSSVTTALAPPAPLAAHATPGAALSTSDVDDRLERGELRSQWLRDTELTGGVRGRDARLDHEVDVERRTPQQPYSDLLYQCRQQHDLLQHVPDPRVLWFLSEVRVQVLLPSTLASISALAAALATALATAPGSAALATALATAPVSAAAAAATAAVSAAAWVYVRRLRAVDVQGLHRFYECIWTRP